VFGNNGLKVLFE
jgi:hypothetical protein